MRLFKSILLLLAVANLASCISRKEIAYFYETDAVLDSVRTVHLEQHKRGAIEIKTNDQLTISVSSSEQEAAIPFNLPVVGSGNVLEGNDRAMGTPRLQTYLVDQEGFIQFPVLGAVKVSGITRNELRTLLENEIMKYVKKPIVSIRLSNFQVSVLGEVARPGTFSVADEYMSLPKALGLAGDLTIYGKRENVLVMREEEDGIKKVYLDLTDNEIVNSPYYYLQQNDVVYVEPNGPQRQSASYNRNASIYISIASVLVSLAVLISR